MFNNNFSTWCFSTQLIQRYSHTFGNFDKNIISQGLKYVKLTFSNNEIITNSKRLNNHDSSQPGALHLNSKGYVKHSGMDYFPGGMDSCNTEKALISNNGRGNNLIVFKIS